MPVPKNYYQKIEEGYPFWIAEGRTLAGHVRHTAGKKKWARTNKKGNLVATRKYRDKMVQLYGGRLEKVEARMLYEYGKGVVNLGTKEIS